MTCLIQREIYFFNHNIDILKLFSSSYTFKPTIPYVSKMKSVYTMFWNIRDIFIPPGIIMKMRNVRQESRAYLLKYIQMTDASSTYKRCPLPLAKYTSRKDVYNLSVYIFRHFVLHKVEYLKTKSLKRTLSKVSGPTFTHLYFKSIYRIYRKNKSCAMVPRYFKIISVNWINQFLHTWFK